ncbi:cation diffusion facilitator family transporter [Halalkalibacterium ligniniphilum]|uniref:cation diffusion facilitator family transporter n=1 Tax=Halalkalibacterium ligniniphilum TaxID=1134413 RepID=UPI0003493122|nr:cation diffusion facilitator family transporter [Halalkalibacterium ligniniphilum]
MERYQELKKGELGAWVSIITYLMLAIIKLFIGYTYSSEALRADGLNNTTDIIASIAVLIGLKISQKPPDKDHPYGHFRAETIASLVASFIIMAVGLQVLIGAGQSILSPKQESPDLIAAWTALASTLVMYGVYVFNKRLAKKVNSQALMAAAADNRADAFVSIGVFVGIFASQLGVAWLDTLTALVIGMIICKTAWDIFKDASHSLTDGFHEKDLQEIKKTIEKIPDVKSLKDIKARYLGSVIHVDVTIEVSSALNVKESHDIADEIEKELHKKYKVGKTHIHTEPSS